MNIKTELCRQYELTLTEMLGEYVDDIVSFQQSYIPSKHYIVAEYYIFTPKELLFNQKGSISAKSVDTDAHKVMKDTIYKVIGIDDKVERDTRFFTPVSHDGNWNVIIILKLEILCNLENISTVTQNLIAQMKKDSMSYALL